MQKTMDETQRRREKQIKYNEDNGLSPQQIVKSIESIMGQTKVADSKLAEQHAYVESNKVSIAADPVVQYMNKEELKKLIAQTRKSMERAAKDLDFIEAARLRDEMYELEKMMKA